VSRRVRDPRAGDHGTAAAAAVVDVGVCCRTRSSAAGDEDVQRRVRRRDRPFHGTRDDGGDEPNCLGDGVRSEPYGPGRRRRRVIEPRREHIWRWQRWSLDGHPNINTRRAECQRGKHNDATMGWCGSMGVECFTRRWDVLSLGTAGSFCPTRLATIAVVMWGDKSHSEQRHEDKMETQAGWVGMEMTTGIHKYGGLGC
jgi:hypothetical protein